MEVSLLVELLSPLMFQETVDDRIPELAVVPQFLSLATLEHEADLVVQRYRAFVVAEGPYLDTMQSSTSEAPVQGPFDSFCAVALALVLSYDCYTDFGKAMME